MNSAAVHVDDAAIAEYYSDPIFSICHMSFCIERICKNPMLLAQSLKISEERLNAILTVLEKCGLIAFTHGQLTVVKDNLFLNSSSALSKSHALNFRLDAVETFRNHPDSNDYFVTISLASTPKIHKKFLARWKALLEDMSKEIVACEPTDVYQLNFDLYKISRKDT